MQLSEQDIVKYKNLVKEAFVREISLAEARDSAEHFLRLFELVYSYHLKGSPKIKTLSEHQHKF